MALAPIATRGVIGTEVSAFEAGFECGVGGSEHGGVGGEDGHWKARAVPEIRFEDQQLSSSSAGLAVFQPLLQCVALNARLHGCFAHLKASPFFGARHCRALDRASSDRVPEALGFALLPS